MILAITETRRSCNRVSGKTSYDVTSKAKVDAKLGIIPFNCVGKRVFTIDTIDDNSATITIHNANSSYNSTFQIQKGESVIKESSGFLVFAVGFKYEFELA